MKRDITFHFRAEAPKKHTKSALKLMFKKQLIERVMMLETLRNDWRDGIIQLQETIEEQAKEIESLRDDLGRMSIQSNQRLGKIKDLEDQLTESEVTVKELVRTEEILRGEISDLKSANQNLQGEIKRLMTEEDRSIETIEQMEEAIVEKNRYIKELEKARPMLTDTQVEIIDYARDLESDMQKLSRMEKDTNRDWSSEIEFTKWNTEQNIMYLNNACGNMALNAGKDTRDDEIERLEAENTELLTKVANLEIKLGDIEEHQRKINEPSGPMTLEQIFIQSVRAKIKEQGKEETRKEVEELTFKLKNLMLEIASILKKRNEEPTEPTTTRSTRAKIKQQGKKATREELAQNKISLETILGVDRGTKPRIILITWRSYLQTTIADNDRALDYIIQNFDSIESVDYVDFETV